MPAYLSPIGNSQESDANGAPLSGGQIATYAAGTSTPIATYTSSAGSTPQTNPIVLNSSGLPANPIWLPAGQAVKLVIKDSGGVTLRTVDDVTGVNDPTNASTADQWVTFTGAPTYISATSFSLGGDQTNTFQVNRRLRSDNTGGTIYSTITAASYSPGTGLTTVTVVNDSGSLDSGLNVVAYGLLSTVNTALPYLTGMVVGRAYSEYTTHTGITAVIPVDDTIPQSTEGTQILSVSITPKSATNRLRARALVWGANNTTTSIATAAIFSSASANALRAVAMSDPTASTDYASVSPEVEWVPGSTSPVTISVRVGVQAGASFYVNGNSGGRAYGGSAACTLVVEEIAA